MTKRLLHFITLLFVMLTTMSLNVAADTYSVAPSQLQPKVTVTPSDEYVNVPIRLTNWGTNPVSRLRTRFSIQIPMRHPNPSTWTSRHRLLITWM